jgi:hypothetical protein
MRVIIAMQNKVVNMSKIADKRIPVKPATWESLHNLKKPGQTFDELIKDLIATQETQQIENSAEQIEKDVLNQLCNGEITFKEAKRELNISDKELEFKLDHFTWIPSGERLKELCQSEIESIKYIDKICKKNKQS